MALLEVNNLRIEIDSRDGIGVAVDGISFSIDRGEVLGIVGESGAGKSLTVDAITGLLPPSSSMAEGEIALDGRRIDHLSEKQLQHVRGAQIGVILQDPMTSLNPLFTVGDQLFETVRAHSDLDRQAAQLRSLELLHEVGIPAPKQRFDSFPHQLSGGLRQRVVIALALAGQPQLLIADEPTTALDVSIQAQILDLLKRLCREHNMAVLLISHDMGVVTELADRVCVMYAGRIVESAPTDSLVHEPAHPYTQGLLASMPSISEPTARLSQIDGTMPGVTDTIKGCAFSPRCAQALDACKRKPPQLERTADDRLSACWLTGQGEADAG